MGLERPDHFVPVPPIPGPSADAIWFDTGPAGWPGYKGMLGNMKFDQPVTLFVETQPVGGSLAVMNGVAGAGEIIPAHRGIGVRSKFLGYRTRVRIRTGEIAPSAEGWHLDGRVTADEI